MMVALILIPLIGSLLSLFGSRHLCLLISLVELCLCSWMALTFDYQSIDASLLLGFLPLELDGLSIPFLLLTTALVPMCLLVHDKDEGCFHFLVLETLLVLFFTSSDLLYFFVFFEASLIPMFFTIGLWGSNNRIYASYKILMYTLAGSIPFLASIAYLKFEYGDTGLFALSQELAHAPQGLQNLLWWGMFIAFATKIPMVPLHTWLPDAHVQAPTSGSVLLAGVLIKMGGYGLIKVLIPLLPGPSIEFTEVVMIMSIIAVVYASLISLVQKDMKKLVAYSSIAHMGFVTSSAFSLNSAGLNGAIFQMVSHGLISGGLFLCVGFLYKRTNSREIDSCSGLVNTMPMFSVMFIALSMASIGLPSTSGFIGEFLSIIGVFQFSYWNGIAIASGVILGSLYMLWLCKRVIWGNNTGIIELKDVSCLEFSLLMTLVISIFVIGIYPDLIFNMIKKPVNLLVGL